MTLHIVCPFLLSIIITRSKSGDSRVSFNFITPHPQPRRVAPPGSEISCKGTSTPHHAMLFQAMLHWYTLILLHGTRFQLSIVSGLPSGLQLFTQFPRSFDAKPWNLGVPRIFGAEENMASWDLFTSCHWQLNYGFTFSVVSTSPRNPYFVWPCQAIPNTVPHNNYTSFTFNRSMCALSSKQCPHNWWQWSHGPRKTFRSYLRFGIARMTSIQRVVRFFYEGTWREQDPEEARGENWKKNM